jgi:ribose transport system substrate-binding protein
MITTLNGSLRSLAAATCALAILTGAATAQDNKLIGAALADQKSLFYIAAGDGMKAAAEEAGLTLNLVSANNNANEQVNQIDNLLVQQPGALLFISQDSTAAGQASRQQTRQACRSSRLTSAPKAVPARS